VARHGYHSVAIGDIGNAAGITGRVCIAILRASWPYSSPSWTGSSTSSSVMRHRSWPLTADERAILDQLVADQVRFVLTKRCAHSGLSAGDTQPPEEDKRRLRLKQRRYIEEWVTVLELLRPDVSMTKLNRSVHAAISAIQSLVHYNTGWDGTS